MLSDVARPAVFFLCAAHVALHVWLYAPDWATCKDTQLPFRHVQNDLEVSRDRAHAGFLFHLAAGVDVAAIVFISVLSRPKVGKHDMAGVSRWIPAVMIVSNIAFRARGPWGSSYDSKSCSSLSCPVSSFSADLKGCETSSTLGFEVNWNLRENWCPLPKWYETTNAAAACGGLQNTPDVASCYLYGCTTYFLHRYYGVRVVIVNSFLLAIAALLPFSPFEVYHYDKKEANMKLKKS